MKITLLTLSILLACGLAQAATFTVTSTADAGAGTFRQAVIDANASAGIDDIVFSSGTDGFPILVTTGPCVVTESVNITGNGISNTVITGSGLSRILEITTDGVRLWVEDLSITNAVNSAVFVNAASGANFTNCVFALNNAGAGNGGAIQFIGTSSADTCRLMYCTLDLNGANNGAGIALESGRLFIYNSTISNNTATGQGGGLWANGGFCHAKNSTFSDNSADMGGGIYDDLLGLGSYFVNCTVANNNGTSEGGGIHSGGTTSVSQFSVYNCIFGDNISASGADMHLYGAFFGSFQFNIVESCVNVTGLCPVWFSTADPLLDPAGLVDNGGVTLTIALMPGSPAVDNGDSPFTVYLDQIDQLRCPNVDIGAFESNPGTNTTSAFPVSTCTDYTVPSGDETYTVSAVVMDTIPNSGGCDSIMTITMTINPAETSTFSANACASYTVPSGDETYTVAGTYMDTIPAFDGCDSIMTINLSIDNTSSSYSDIGCPTYTVPSGDETYGVPGVYNDTIPNAAGCDSIMTITVAIGASSTNSFSVFDCATYTVPSGDETYTSSGVFNDTIPNASGCDSVMTITVDIGNSTSTLTLTECKTYTTPSGNETFTIAGIYNTMDTIPNAAGCDSIITINLTLNVVNFGMNLAGGVYTSFATGAVYQWIDCATMTDIPGETNQSFTPTVNGDYAVVVTENGCTDTSACIEILDVGIDENDFSSLTKLYPNPSGGEFSIILPAKYEKIELKIYNSIGELIVEKTYSDIQQIGQNLQSEPGFYLIELRTPDNQVARLNIVLE